MSEESRETFIKMIMKSDHKFVIFKIQNSKKVVVDMKDDPMCTENKVDDKIMFDYMKGELPQDEPRYIIYEFGFRTREHRPISKLAFIFW